MGKCNEVTGTEHDGICEGANCGQKLTVENLVEGDLGFYCSQACRDACEDGPWDDWREDFHADG